MDSTTSLAKHSAVDSDHVVFVKKLAEYSHRLFVVVLATGNGHDLPKLFRQVGIQLESPFYLHCSGCWHLPELCNQPVVIQPHTGKKEVRISAFRSPNTNAFIERFIQSIKQECLDHFVVFSRDHFNHICDENSVHKI